MATYFENPSNNYVETVTTLLSWLWALIWAPIYFAVRGIWGWAFISLVAAVFTFAATNITFCFCRLPHNEDLLSKDGLARNFART